MNKKVKIKIVLEVDYDLNEEAVYQLLTRLEHQVYNSVHLGMLANYHRDDAALTDIKISVNSEDI